MKCEIKLSSRHAPPGLYIDCFMQFFYHGSTWEQTAGQASVRKSLGWGICNITRIDHGSGMSSLLYSLCIAWGNFRHVVVNPSTCFTVTVHSTLTNSLCFCNRRKDWLLEWQLWLLLSTTWRPALVSNFISVFFNTLTCCILVFRLEKKIVSLFYVEKPV